MGLCYTGEKPVKEVYEIIGETLEKLIIHDPKVAYIDADLMGSLKTKFLWKKFPENVFNTGIQEANMIGIAAGMYLNGYKPYVHSFSPFVTRRVFDQIFVSGAYAKKSIRIIGSDAGIMATKNGGTHMCFEDIAMMRTIPEACVVDVSDPIMCGAFLELSKDRPGITYIRTPRRDLSDIYVQDEKFTIGRSKLLRDGSDVTLIGCGIMVATCLQAAEILAQAGISAKVVDIVTIKPIDKEMILQCAMTTAGIVTAENASVIGGLGSAVCEVLADSYPARVERIGIEDEFGCVGDEIFLRKKYRLTVADIVQRVKHLLNKN